MIVTPDELRQAWGSANGVREAIRNGRKLTGTSQGAKKPAFIADDKGIVTTIGAAKEERKDSQNIGRAVDGNRCRKCGLSEAEDILHYWRLDLGRDCRNLRLTLSEERAKYLDPYKRKSTASEEDSSVIYTGIADLLCHFWKPLQSPTWPGAQAWAEGIHTPTAAGMKEFAELRGRHSSLDLPLFFLAYAFELGIPAYDSFEEFYMSNDSVFVHQFSGSWLSESLDYQAKQQQPIKSTCSMKHVGCRSCQMRKWRHVDTTSILEHILESVSVSEQTTESLAKRTEYRSTRLAGPIPGSKPD
ncbi:hypothetical protein VTP01DRAFT_8670 [Rhizomucor pusillus]|uniref:uncharacterized protein n=1 Tax=Rhizomucor pusillus TaxID=4840 RepID=UPI0037423793